MLAQVPVIANPADFPGQMGVPGSASGLGLRMIPGGNSYYVAKTTEVSIASDSNDGTDPTAPRGDHPGCDNPH